MWSASSSIWSASHSRRSPLRSAASCSFSSRALRSRKAGFCWPSARSDQSLGLRPETRSRLGVRALSLRRLRLLSLGELAPEDLSRRGARHFLDELDLTHALVVGDPFFHECDELVGGGLRVRAKLHEGLRDLAGFVVALADHAGVGDRGVFAEDGLHLGRPDAESLVLDELLLAIDDEDVPLLVLLADIARIEPAVADHIRRVLGLVPIAAHHLRALHADLADLIRRERSRPAVQIDDLVARPG